MNPEKEQRSSPGCISGASWTDVSLRVGRIVADSCRDGTSTTMGAMRRRVEVPRITQARRAA